MISCYPCHCHTFWKCNPQCQQLLEYPFSLMHSPSILCWHSLNHLYRWHQMPYEGWSWHLGWLCIACRLHLPLWISWRLHFFGVSSRTIGSWCVHCRPNRRNWRECRVLRVRPWMIRHWMLIPTRPCWFCHRQKCQISWKKWRERHCWL